LEWDNGGVGYCPWHLELRSESMWYYDITYYNFPAKYIRLIDKVPSSTKITLAIWNSNLTYPSGWVPASFEDGGNSDSYPISCFVYIRD
jgi:hypothetical protein